MAAPDYEQLLATQLVMNRRTWAELERHGITEESELHLDFSYDAPSHEAAEGLRAFLHEQTDYDVRVESGRFLWRRRWRVEGTTQKTKVSHPILDEWVMWMVTAGKECSCLFDGWGTPVGGST
jgi:hypothetical protein